MMNHKNKVVYYCLFFFSLLTGVSHAEDAELLFGTTGASSEPIGQVNNVTFPRAFANGVTPIVFIMPSIRNNNPNGDGPASIRLSNISRTGFSWTQAEAPLNAHTRIPSELMTNVSWIAIAPGEHQLSDGQTLFAGSAPVQRAFNMSNSDWTDVASQGNYQLSLSQIQTNANNCWLTSVSRFSSGRLLLNMDVSRVYTQSGSQRRCQPGNSATLNDERVGYLLMRVGSGIIELHHRNVRYQFGAHDTDTQNNRNRNLAQQCSQTRNFSGFSATPILVVKKNTRNGAHGGWLRRCRLTATRFSVVNDEDIYTENDRRHIRETIAFAAFEDQGATPVHHFELDYTSNPLTCRAEPVTIRACANDDCSRLYTNTVTATLTPTLNNPQGWYVNGSRTNFVTLNQGTAQVNFRNYSLGNRTIGVSNSTPALNGANSTLCRRGNGAKSVAACTLSFARSGFDFDIPDKYANQPVNATIRAVQANDTNQRCVPAFSNTTRQLSFSSRYIDPDSSDERSRISLNGALLSSPSFVNTLISIDFNAQGEAPITVNYPDAGSVELRASLVATGEEQGLDMRGSDTFVSVPVGFCIEPVNGGMCSSNDENCTAFWSAGDAFQLSIQAKAWQNNNDTDYCDNRDTHNYQQQNLAMSHQLLAPSGGAVGQLGVHDFDYAISSGAHIVNQSVSETGIFRFAVDAPPYLGSAIPINHSESRAVGRFVPARFEMTSASVMPTCQAPSKTPFSYMDQPYDAMLTLSAVNAAGEVTTNYTGNYAKASAQLFAANSGTNLSNRLTAISGRTDNLIPTDDLAWDHGVSTLALQPEIRRVASTVNNQADGSYVNVFTALSVNDNDDNLTGLAQLDFARNNVNCSLGCEAKKISAVAQDIRHGRIVLENTYGAENDVLNMPVRAEYWHNNNWQLNTDDSCTVINNADVTMASNVDNPSLGYDFNPDLSAPQSITRSVFQNQLASGKGIIHWNSTASGNNALYRGKITAPIEVPDYLKWYWRWSSPVNENLLLNPRAAAYFGQFSGHQKVIYWREVN